MSELLPIAIVITGDKQEIFECGDYKTRLFIIDAAVQIIGVGGITLASKIAGEQNLTLA